MYLLQNQPQAQVFSNGLGDVPPMKVSRCQSADKIVSPPSPRLRSSKFTVLTLNTPITLSHSVPLFGRMSSSLDNDLARLSTRLHTSAVEYSSPVSPQVNGAFERFIGCRPYFSLSMNSHIGIESGGSNGSFGTHAGDVKTIPAIFSRPRFGRFRRSV